MKLLNKKKNVTIKKYYSLLPEEHANIPVIYQKQVGTLKAQLDAQLQKTKQQDGLITKQASAIESLQTETASSRPSFRGRQMDWGKVLSLVQKEKIAIRLITRQHTTVGFLKTIKTEQVGTGINHVIYGKNRPRKPTRSFSVLRHHNFEALFHKPFQLCDAANSGMLVLNMDNDGRFIEDVMYEENGEARDVDEVIAEMGQTIEELEEEASTAKKREKKERSKRMLEKIRSDGDTDVIQSLNAHVTQLEDTRASLNKSFVRDKKNLSEKSAKIVELEKKILVQEQTVDDILKKLAEKQPMDQREIEELSLREKLDYITDLTKKLEKPAKILIKTEGPQKPTVEQGTAA